MVTPNPERSPYTLASYVDVAVRGFDKFVELHQLEPDPVRQRMVELGVNDGNKYLLLELESGKVSASMAVQPAEFSPPVPDLQIFEAFITRAGRVSHYFLHSNLPSSEGVISTHNPLVFEAGVDKTVFHGWMPPHVELPQDSWPASTAPAFGAPAIRLQVHLGDLYNLETKEKGRYPSIHASAEAATRFLDDTERFLLPDVKRVDLLSLSRSILYTQWNDAPPGTTFIEGPTETITV